MNFTSTESKQFVGRYLQALSGQSKTADLVERFVSDPSLAAHIRDVEAAFPEYELIAETLIAEQDLVAMLQGTPQFTPNPCAARFTECIAAHSPGSRPRADRWRRR